MYLCKLYIYLCIHAVIVSTSNIHGIELLNLTPYFLESQKGNGQIATRVDTQGLDRHIEYPTKLYDSFV